MTDNKLISGLAASPGVGIAQLVRVKPVNLELSGLSGYDPGKEMVRLKKAQQRVRSQIETMKNEASNQHEEWTLKIFDSHLFLIQDPELETQIIDAINNDRVSAEFAVLVVRDVFAEMLKNTELELMQERSNDLIDVTNRIIAELTNQQPVKLSDLQKPVILVAHDLSPLETSRLNSNIVKGIITAVGSYNGHTAIMARSLGIPAVTGLGQDMDLLKNDHLVILDGMKGTVLLRPDPSELAQARKIISDLQEEKNRLKTFINKKTVTRDGTVINIGSHLSRLEDLEKANEYGAEGIGLFRTEFLYMEKSDFPDEETQFSIYKTVVEKMNPRPVIIRTMDIGGDKKLSYEESPTEDNPFLGMRGIRYSLKNPKIFRVQIRAILRATAYGNVKIMFPMVTTTAEVHQARKILIEEEENLKQQGLQVSDNYEVGIMVEVPAAALIAQEIAPIVDFFSIGTNDLIQYTMAADRVNQSVSYLYQPLHPAILRLIEMVTRAADHHGIWTGVCGDMASDLKSIPLLLGLGVKELSMSAPQIPAARELISQLEMNDLISKAAETLN